MTCFAEKTFYMLTDMTSVQLNLMMACFLPLVWYNQLIMLPCFKEESARMLTFKKKNHKGSSGANLIKLIDWLIEWCFTPLLTVFQSYHGDNSHYSCFPGFHQY